jgi:hypothetical protein
MSLQIVFLHNISNMYMHIGIDIYAHRQYCLCTFVQMFMNIGRDIMHFCIALSNFVYYYVPVIKICCIVS